MNQVKIGEFLKKLRNEVNLTQEEVAEKFLVSQRSVSRWENGNTMPDISLLIELADFYKVDIREILNGERKDTMKSDLKETLEMVCDYTSLEKKNIIKRMYNYSTVLFIVIIFQLVLYIFNIPEKNHFFDSLMIYLFFLGLFYTISIIIHSLQLKGNMNKNKINNLKKDIIPFMIALGLLSILLIIIVL